MLNYSLEFKGGTSTNITFAEDYTLDEIDENIVPLIEKATGDKNVQVQKVEGTKQVIFKTQTLNLEKREAFHKAMVDHFKVNEDEITAENISSTGSGNASGCSCSSSCSNDMYAFIYLVPFQGYPVCNQRSIGACA